jgi:hypothetical protein
MYVCIKQLSKGRDKVVVVAVEFGTLEEEETGRSCHLD